MHPKKQTNQAIEVEMNGITEQSVHGLMIGAVLICLLAIPFALERDGLAMGEIFAIFFVIWGCFMIYFKEQVTLTIKIYGSLLFITALAVYSILNYGLLGNGMIWAMFSIMLSLFLIERLVVPIITILLTSLLISAWRFIWLGAEVPIAPELYLITVASWGVALLGSFCFVLLATFVAKKQKEKISNLVLQLEAKNIEISRIADFDHLTGLATRHYFDSAYKFCLHQCNREKRRLYLCFLDLDGFKKVNDTDGHDAGDHILKKVASRLKACGREEDVVARIGGDEFVILITNQNSVDMPVVCSRIISRLNKPIQWQGKMLKVGVSIGVAEFRKGKDDANSVMKRADKAMYKVKRMGKNNYEIA